MPTDRRAALAAVAVVVVSAAAAGIAAAAKLDRSPKAPDGSSFEMTGSVDWLLPTPTSTLELKVENPHAFAIQVVEVTVTTGDPNGACSPSDLVVGPVPVPFEVPTAGERTVPVNVSLAGDVHDACQGATWPLQYTGTAERLHLNGPGR